ncbi:hypothetical protein [Maridesulfovibrio zosterae]|uniref:hypothetical protein n=1 Tax=Maridesulfovibrio zosterae TaxID=82171 RepID=UPI00041AB088|nr:hypothetical protein [Maridesulfovibrio zosterae]
MSDIALSIPVEGGVMDTSIKQNLPTERPDHVAAALDDPAMRAHEERQQHVVDDAIHSLTGKGNLIDRII